MKDVCWSLRESTAAMMSAIAGMLVAALEVGGNQWPHGCVFATRAVKKGGGRNNRVLLSSEGLRYRQVADSQAILGLPLHVPHHFHHHISNPSQHEEPHLSILDFQQFDQVMMRHDLIAQVTCQY